MRLRALWAGITCLMFGGAIPTMADMPTVDDAALWLQRSIYTCQTAESVEGGKVSADQTKEACLDVVAITRLMTAFGYCYNKEYFLWRECGQSRVPKSSPPPKPGEISLPPNAEGQWTNLKEQAEIVFLNTKWIQYQGKSDKGLFDVSCHINSQNPTMWAYDISCPNGIGGTLTFYDTGVLEFDFTRFAHTPTAKTFMLSPTSSPTKPAASSMAKNTIQKPFTLPGVGSDPDEMNIVGTLYGVPDLCQAYHQNVYFQGVAPNNDGLWWVDDKRMVGHEIYCEIKGKTESKIDFLCHYEGDETEKQSSPIKSGDGWIEIGSQRFEKCSNP